MMQRQSQQNVNDNHSAVLGGTEEVWVMECSLERKVNRLRIAFNQQFALVVQQQEVLDQLKKHLDQTATYLQLAKEARQVYGNVPITHLIFNDKIMSSSNGYITE